MIWPFLVWWFERSCLTVRLRWWEGQRGKIQNDFGWWISPAVNMAPLSGSKIQPLDGFPCMFWTVLWIKVLPRVPEQEKNQTDHLKFKLSEKVNIIVDFVNKVRHWMDKKTGPTQIRHLQAHMMNPDSRIRQNSFLRLINMPLLGKFTYSIAKQANETRYSCSHVRPEFNQRQVQTLREFTAFLRPGWAPGRPRFLGHAHCGMAGPPGWVFQCCKSCL